MESFGFFLIFNIIRSKLPLGNRIVTSFALYFPFSTVIKNYF